MSKVYYVYVHKNPITGKVFYVGKGKDSRATDCSNRNKKWKRYVAKHGFVATIVRRGLSEQCSLTLERLLISLIGKDNLCNIADGGSVNSGWKHSDSARTKIAAFQRQKTPHPASLKALEAHRKKIPSAQSRVRMSLAKKGKPRGPLPECVRRKISESHKGIRPTQETLEKMRLAKLGQRKREQNNKFDPTIRVFTHDLHGVFVGCSYDLRNKYGIGAACVRSIITGRQKTAKGWKYKGVKDGFKQDDRGADRPAKCR